MSAAAVEELKLTRAELVRQLGPAGVTFTSVAALLGGWNVIWYWGKETSFAGGRTIDQVVASIERQVFGGL